MRGYQKRVIYLKNTGSRNFEEAYFIVRADVSGEKSSSALMIEEANRIIDENFGERRGRLAVFSSYFLTFVLGAAVSAIILFLSDIFFGIF